MKELIKEFEFETEEQFYDYIIESKINGQGSQVIELFNYLPEDNQAYFLNQYLNDNDPHHQAVKEICIKVLTGVKIPKYFNNL